MQGSLWRRCLAHLEAELPEQQFNTWIRPLQAVEDDGALAPAGAEPLCRRLGQREHRQSHRRAGRRGRLGARPAVVLEVGSRAVASRRRSRPSPVRTNVPARRAEDLRRRCSAAGSTRTSRSRTSSRARAISSRAPRPCRSAENPGRAYNPLFIYGGVGLGKTHLMHAVGNHDPRAQRRARVAYVHSERFVGDMVKALQHNTINDFKTAYRSLDALLIDDIQFFAGKDRSQEEFFHTFNALLEGQQQIILTCDRYPKEVEGLEERLKSRFGWGLTVAIEPPELETCVAILMSKAAATRRAICRRKSRSSSPSASAPTCASSKARCAAWSRTRSSPAAPITLDFAKEALQGPAGAAGAAGHDREHPEDRRRVLQDPRRRPAVEAAQPLDRAAAPGGDGAVEGTDESQPAGDRRCVRRARSHDGAACVPRDQRAARVAARAPARTTQTC